MAIFYLSVAWRDQAFRLPPDMRDWLPEDQLVWTPVEMVAKLDTSLAAGLGLARFGTVAIDGTKIPANAWIDANREWLDRQAKELAEAVGDRRGGRRRG